MSGALLIVCILILPLFQGCTTTGSSVIAATGTIIGVEVSQNQTTQTPMAVLGYKRAEIAYVPTNRGTPDTTKTGNDESGADKTANKSGLPSMGAGAKDSANVVMELRYVGIFDMGSASGIYQRLAVGDKAVSQPGASLMFAKDGTGKIDSTAVEAISVAQKNLFAQVSSADWKKAVEAAGERAKVRREKIAVIVNNVKKDAEESSIDSGKLGTLVGNANLNQTDPLMKIMLKLKNTADLQAFLDEPGEKFVDTLYKKATEQ